MEKKQGERDQTDRQRSRATKVRSRAYKSKLSKKQPRVDKWVDIMGFQINKHLGGFTASK